MSQVHAQTEEAARSWLGRSLAHWWARQRERQELEALGPTGVEALAHDIGLSPTVLEEIVSRGGEGVEELPRMMQALGLDPRTVEARDPVLMRDLTLTCAACPDVRRCRRALARDDAAGMLAHGCPNAESFEGLLAEAA